MLSEAINSIKATLCERIVSPLFGAVITAFVTTNHKSILLVFDSQNHYLNISYHRICSVLNEPNTGVEAPLHGISNDRATFRFSEREKYEA